MTGAIGPAELIAVGLAFAAIVVTPAILFVLQGHRNDADRQATYARQDLVAERAEAAASKAAQAAHEAGTAASHLQGGQDEAARLLAVNNEVVAKTAAETQGQLTVIHTLVNSSLTDAMTRELSALRAQHTMLLEVRALRTERGDAVDPKMDERLEELAAVIAELSAKLADRAHQQDLATAQIQDTPPPGTAAKGVS